VHGFLPDFYENLSPLLDRDVISILGGSIVGKQVLEVPPANIGGSEYVIAICNRGLDLQKV
jgi:hypothetical protein